MGQPSSRANVPEPHRQVRFCTGPTGARIAYATAGRGPALLVPAAWISHLELLWQDPAYRGFFTPLAAARTVVRQLAATGSPDHVGAQLERWDDVADIVVIGLPPGIPWPTIEATLRVAAPRPPATARPSSPAAGPRTADRHRAMTTTAASLES
jgi:hypothetical protein